MDARVLLAGLAICRVQSVRPHEVFEMSTRVITIDALPDSGSFFLFHFGESDNLFLLAGISVAHLSNVHDCSPFKALSV